MEKGEFVKKVFGTLSAISLFGLLCAAGALENGTIGLSNGTVLMIAALSGFCAFGKFAGVFDADEEKESRPRSNSPKGGKRKSSIKL